MKKLIRIKKIAFFLLFSLYLLPVFSQELSEDKQFKNGIGLTFTDLINSSFLITYERAVGEHISVGLGLGYKGDEGLIRLSGLDTDELKTNDLTYSGSKILPEFRYYLNAKDNNMLSGFYFGAYMKFVNYKSDLVGTFIDSEAIEYDLSFEGKTSVSSFGLMVGYKLSISKRLSINFLIAGPGAGFYNFELKNIIEPPQEFYDALNTALENYSLFDFLGADFEFNDTQLKADLTLPTFRYGMTISYSF